MLTPFRPTDTGTDTGTAVSLHGAPLDTGNLGVSALGIATIDAVAARIPGVRVILFDNGRGLRRTRLGGGAGAVLVDKRGAWISRRLHRPESLWSMYAAARTHPRLNANVLAMDRSAVVLDLSGGDSFTDLYGKRRFDLVTLPKRIALRRGRPLVFLPQTYGPFREARHRQLAADLVAASAQAWARDAEGYRALQRLLGDRFDPSRHRQGVDVAFALPQVDPGSRAETLAAWLDEAPAVGVNVSGLLANDPVAAQARFGIAGDYRRAMIELVERLVGAGQRVLLVPHVISGDAEADDRACRAIMDAVGVDRDALAMLSTDLEVTEVKHVISRLTWFAGARMHSTIAALSTGVPAAAVAYSDKFAGVFAGCGLAHRSLDARKLDGPELVEALVEAWSQRDADRQVMGEPAAAVVRAAERQFDDIIGAVPGTPTSGTTT